MLQWNNIRLKKKQLGQIQIKLNKKYKTELVVSKDVLDAANINTKQFTSETIKIRGRTGELEIYSLEHAYNLKL